MDKSKRAMRSYAITTEPEMPELEVQDEMQEMKDESDRITATYASLQNHPGWQMIKKDFDATIASYRSGRSVAAAIQAGKSNAEVGDLVRTSNAIADELERKVLTVEGAAQALEEKDGRRTKSKGV